MLSVYIHNMCVYMQKVKAAPLDANQAQRGGIDILLYPYLNSVLEGGGYSTLCPGCITARKETGTHSTGG
jgi:hypothetical protein